MRRIRLRYTGGPGSDAKGGDIFARPSKQAQWELIDLDTGLPIPYVQALKFEIEAETMLPSLTLKLIPEEIEIEGPVLVHDLGGKRYYAGRQELQQQLPKDSIFSWMPPIDAEPQPPEERRT